jgi:hypothetical protein
MENYVKKLIGYAWRRVNSVVELGRLQRKNLKLMLKSNGMLSKKIGAVGWRRRC